jgi:hypothetical protein
MLSIGVRRVFFALFPALLSAVAAAQGQAAQPAAPCITGYVWRNAFPGDAVCVTPQTREDAAADNAAAEGRHQPGSTNCLTGFVWRAARPTDLVCVTPEIKARVAEDNTMASRRLVAQSRPVPAATPAPTPAQPMTNGQCRTYAQGAVADFNQAMSVPKCRVPVDGRWNNNIQGHYQWCLGAPADQRTNETKLRSDHLFQCGGRANF